MSSHIFVWIEFGINSYLVAHALLPDCGMVQGVAKEKIRLLGCIPVCVCVVHVCVCMHTEVKDHTLVFHFTFWSHGFSLNLGFMGVARLAGQGAACPCLPSFSFLCGHRGSELRFLCLCGECLTDCLPSPCFSFSIFPKF